VLLTLGTIVVYPFEMDTIVALSGDRLVAMHYGLYNAFAGFGISIGNLLTGVALDSAETADLPWVRWLGLAGLGGARVLAIRALNGAGHLTPGTVLKRPGKTDRLAGTWSGGNGAGRAEADAAQ
jgi:hypothetical protein